MAVLQSHLAATQLLDIIISINLLTLPINNTNMKMNTIIKTWSIIEQSADMTTRISIRNKGSLTMMTTEDMMSKATMNKKEMTAKQITQAMKDKLSIMIDSLINTMISEWILLRKDSGIDDTLESESELNILRNNIDQATWNIINDNTKTPTSLKDADKKKITMKVRCI